MVSKPKKAAPILRGQKSLFEAFKGKSSLSTVARQAPAAGSASDQPQLPASNEAAVIDEQAGRPDQSDRLSTVSEEPQSKQAARKLSDSQRLSGSCELSSLGSLVKDSLSRSTSGQKPQLYSHFLVYDFEATTNEARDLIPMELIEFSCCILDASSLAITADFQAYIKPTENPILTAFCSQLTGISQATVNTGMTLAEALTKHHFWLWQLGLLDGGHIRCLPITWSEWDLKVSIPPYLRKWHNLRTACKGVLSRANGLRGTVEAAGLQWEGRAHSGLDDARNTAKLAAQLIRMGAVIDVTGAFDPQDLPGRGHLRQATLFPGRPHKKARIVDSSGAWNGSCECGVPAKLCTVKRPGTNMGRQFYGCGTWSILKGRGDCRLMKWADEL